MGKAINVYLKAIHIESGAESSPDLSLYNRVGDLYLKINDTPRPCAPTSAPWTYMPTRVSSTTPSRCAEDSAGESGTNPDLPQAGQLHARKNVVIEAKRGT